MLEHVLKAYLKISRKKYLLPFLEGLINLGRPSAVLFPTELLEQGLGLILSGLNNTLSTQTNLDWVWPYWLELQMDPKGRAFIPTGVNLLTSNLTRRNWISLGIAGSHRESMLDPVGMLTPRAFGWSVLAYLKIEGEQLLPPRFKDPVRQYLKEGHLPCVITEYPVSEAVKWSCEAMGIEEDGEELATYDHYLENRGDRPISLTFGFSIRPYNPLTIGHINKLKFKNRLWRVNRKPGLLVFDEPDRVWVSDRHLGDPMLLDAGDVPDTSGTSRSGILSGVSEFDIYLQPGETRRIRSLATLAKVGPGPKIKFKNLTPANIESAHKRALTYWQKHERRGLTIELPDKKLENAFYAVKNHLPVFDDLDYFSPGTFFYHTHWFRDSSFIAMGFENAGFSEEVARKIPNWLKQQTVDGFFKSQNGEWDSAGQALFTMVNHTRRAGNLQLLEEIYPALRKGVRWLEDQCRRTARLNLPHAGLLPSGFSAEHFGPNDHYFWDNFWGLSGVKAVLWAARKLVRDNDAQRLSTFYEEYRHRLGAAILYARGRTPDGALPCSPYRNLDSAAIGNLIAVSPLDLYTPDTGWYVPTVEFLMGNNLMDGLFYQKIIHTGLNAYLSIQLARALLSLQDERWQIIMAALLHFGGETFTWPEAIHPATGGGCMGDGDHGWAAAEFLNLVRELLVREQDGELHLGEGIPSHWYAGQHEIKLSSAATLHGVVGFVLKLEEQGATLSWNIQRNALQDRVPVHFFLPRYFTPPKQMPLRGNHYKVPLGSDEGTLFFPVQPDQIELLHAHGGCTSCRPSTPFGNN